MGGDITGVDGVLLPGALGRPLSPVLLGCCWSARRPWYNQWVGGAAGGEGGGLFLVGIGFSRCGGSLAIRPAGVESPPRSHITCESLVVPRVSLVSGGKVWMGNNCLAPVLGVGGLGVGWGCCRLQGIVSVPTGLSGTGLRYRPIDGG